MYAVTIRQSLVAHGNIIAQSEHDTSRVLCIKY